MKRQPSLTKHITAAALVLSLALSAILFVLFALLLLITRPISDTLLPLVIGLGVFLALGVVAFLIARGVARRLTAPLSPDAKDSGSVPYVELSPLFERLSKQDAAIEKQLASARRRNHLQTAKELVIPAMAVYGTSLANALSVTDSFFVDLLLFLENYQVYGRITSAIWFSISINILCFFSSVAI